MNFNQHSGDYNMSQAYDLTQLDPSSFEHMVNSLALRVLGAGHTGFGPGSDAGRDGYFEGEAPYPSSTDRWKGRWYIQSKFHKPHLSKDPQAWLLDQIKAELKAFADSNSGRTWPDIWIVATNIDPSGAPMTGAYDKAMRLVANARPKLKKRFHIWSGSRILDFLTQSPEVAQQYGHFLTPGHILTTIFTQLKDAKAEIEQVLRYFIVRQFEEQKYTKLEQAGSDADTRPGIHKLFIDLPFRANEYNLEGLLTAHLVKASGKCHCVDSQLPDTKDWRTWRRHPSRARVWFIRGGPGHGKSTVGQYFSQIQRAAIILQTDGLKVTPTVKGEAESIREAALKAGFWPASPRIPISIELKDYAQWLGQRNKNRQAIGILTYLSERLTSGIEQKVEPGLMKRALNTRSWFVIFDGLDEVPHDVKDIVALEVRTFLDDVAIECNSDLLSICTSRPQGYSGQFSQLDGPTIELMSLSQELALQCAKPVVESGRTPDEAARAFEILKIAINSPSVRELMTTPLQAHIMAVVVRDGGKPPDRRWQLFDNFYQVIKKRESNKNLSDKRLAKLLREDDKLLKTLHNRLGFVLQSRAETSQGAQTHLARAEFKELAEGAVAQMVETGAHETVDTLMRATVDRLVLVSTPDDGDHLRFDIRPLQEFFAAEFLYENLEAERLRKRLEILAGDAHWHEVMHFLLSALVENNRQTELAVAVSVLERLNDGEGETEIRLLRRRLGRGALLTARLLQEGVLEQDKRIRQRFRECLLPITAFSDARDVRSMLNVSQANSLNWELNFLVECMREFDRVENIGATILLAELLPDDDSRVNEVSQFIMSSSGDYLVALLVGMRLPGRNEKPKLLRKWFAKCLISYLSTPRWLDLGGSGLNIAIAILESDTRIAIAAAKELRFTDSKIDLLKSLISEQGETADQPTTDYGIITSIHNETDWTTGKVCHGSWTSQIAETTADVSGLFQFLYRLFRATITRRFSDFQALFSLIPESASCCIANLPRRLKVYLPIDDSQLTEPQVNELKSLSESAYTSLVHNHVINGRRVPRPTQFMRLDAKCTLEQWEALTREHLRIAYHLWSESFWRQGPGPRPSFFKDNRAADLLINALIQRPEVLRQDAGQWGRLLETAPSHSNDLRRAFQSAAQMQVGDTKYWQSEFHPFKLVLPDEAMLLPHLLHALVLHLGPEGHDERGPGDRLAEAHKLVGHLADNVELLLDISRDMKLPLPSRAAATFLSLLHPNNGQKPKIEPDAIVNCYDKEISSWYFRAFTLCLTFLSSEQESVARETVGRLLEKTRADYEARQALRPLFRLWRETSLAPVQTTGVTEKWLKDETD
jgi:hypothetical protein